MYTKWWDYFAVVWWSFVNEWKVCAEDEVVKMYTIGFRFPLSVWRHKSYSREHEAMKDDGSRIVLEESGYHPENNINKTTVIIIKITCSVSLSPILLIIKRIFCTITSDQSSSSQTANWKWCFSVTDLHSSGYFYPTLNSHSQTTNCFSLEIVCWHRWSKTRILLQFSRHQSYGTIVLLHQATGVQVIFVEFDAHVEPMDRRPK